MTNPAQGYVVQPARGLANRPNHAKISQGQKINFVSAGLGSESKSLGWRKSQCVEELLAAGTDKRI
jgi:hypothetical protein